MTMVPTKEIDVIGRHGPVYSHDVMGVEANSAPESIEDEQRRHALLAVRAEAADDVERHGLVAMADMGHALQRAVKMQEGFSHFVDGISLEDVTAEYIAALTGKVIKDEHNELTIEDCEEFFTGLSEFIPELKKTTEDGNNGTGMYL
jgi:hypothetical protein